MYASSRTELWIATLRIKMLILNVTVGTHHPPRRVALTSRRCKLVAFPSRTFP